MSKHTINQLVDIPMIQRLLESYHRLSGMSYGLLDTDGIMLVTVGWQGICERFHRVNPASFVSCIENNAYMQAHMHDGEGDYTECRCGNGLTDTVLPLIIDGEHMATLFIGQFFFDDTPPDREFFRAQALTFGFDPDDYLTALEHVPVFSRSHIRDNMVFLRNMMNVLAETGRNNLRRIREMEDRNALLSVALNNTNDTVLLIDEQLRLAYVNDAACRSLGYSREELLTMTPPDIDPDVTREMYMEMTENILAGLPVVFESRHRTRDGRVFPVEISCSRFEHEGALFSLSVARDITERKRMKETLVASERNFRTLAENLPDVVVRYDRACRRIYVNPAFERVNRLAAHEVLGTSPLELSTELAPLAALFTRRLQEVMESAVSAEFELSKEENGKNSCWFVRVIPENDSDGNVISALTIWVDITERKRMEEALHNREQEFRALVENAQDLIFRYDRDLRRTYVNPAAERLFERPADTLLRKTPEETMLIGPAANAVQIRCIRDVLASGRVVESEMTFTAPDGQVRHYLNCYAPEWGQDGEVASVLSILRDITARKKAENMLRQHEREFRTLAENSPDCIVRYDRECRRVYVNPAFEKLIGKPAAMLLGKTPSEVPVGSSRVGSQTHQAVERVLSEGIPAEIEVTWEESGRGVRCYQVRFVPEYDHDGALVSVLSNARDISEIRSYQQQLHDLAFYDPLTGLSNRAMFNERLTQSLAESARRAQFLGLMFLDLDHFKIVNDIFGHKVGDQLLRESGERIRNTVRDYDIVARLGGDEFAVILPEIRRAEDLGRIAGKILNAFAEPFLIDGDEQYISVSIGITISPLDGTDMVELMQHADVAMYHAKTQGRNSFQFYSQSLTAQVTERQALESGLRKAVSQGELELFYQPKVKLPTGELVGAEALLRWLHPEWGFVPPDTFIGIAEDTGLIAGIGEWVLRKACCTALEWNRNAATPLKIAVNVSGRQFAANDFAETVAGILEETGCRPEWLEIEITESLLLSNSADNLRILEKLHAMGISLAIDDFGTGYSALSYITRFPISTLKIDRSFIQDITSNPESAELVRAIISLAKALRMEIVAEGVETFAQASYLTKCGCGHAQGFLFGRPMPWDKFEAFLGGAAVTI